MMRSKNLNLNQISNNIKIFRIMKKYLMTGVAAIAICAAFTSCSKSGDELYDPGKIDQQNAEKITQTYNEAFIKVFGKPSANQDWGFGKSASTRANSGETVPQTEAYHNMNHNEWADPDKEFGGYTVPDPLTEQQKAVVAAYFQSVPNLTYSDPQWRHFFVQQVYKGGKVDAGKVRNTTEGITAANGTKYDSGNMNLLSVGRNNIHINDFNAGSCSTSNVLDNGQHVGGSSHPDQITLMVNIDDTSCFGYHETGSSTQHNNKAALVSWQTIRDWANANGLNGDCLADNWNRSFLGFDLAIKEGAQAQSDIAARYNDGPESYSYAMVNGEIVSINGNDNIVYNSENIYYLDTNTNMYVAADKMTLQDNEIQAEYRVDGDYKGKYINVDKFVALLNDGWLPVKDKNFREWVKVGKSDGYFSDWIVTLTKAERKNPPHNYTICVIGEDLTVGGSDEEDLGADFDFNDVVFDVALESNETWVRLKAAGGTLPLTIDGIEIHGKFGVATNVMVNTGAGPNKEYVEFKLNNVYTDAKNIPVFVTKGGRSVELTAVQGEPASKIGVKPSYVWCKERVGVVDQYPMFTQWVQALYPGTIVWY
jgi:hypothetical protein